jgi:hypothetical protein
MCCEWMSRLGFDFREMRRDDQRITIGICAPIRRTPWGGAPRPDRWLVPLARYLYLLIYPGEAD